MLRAFVFNIMAGKLKITLLSGIHVHYQLQVYSDIQHESAFISFLFTQSFPVTISKKQVCIRVLTRRMTD
jgi:hypothetical protein